MERNQSDDEYGFDCPHCGAQLPADAKFCRQCGASDDSGWNEEDELAPGDLGIGYEGEDDFDYDDFVAREFPQHAEARRRPAAGWFVAGVALLLCIALVLLGLLR
jgi:hypothetical protein